MQSRWVDRRAKKLEGLEALVYASRLIGEDPELVLWGGGNSSAKVLEKDHMGRDVCVLWIKGSGSDMRTITAKQFTPARLDELLSLMEREEMTDEEMVTYQARCVLDASAPKPSIETLLHAFLPARYVFHTHADAICTLTGTSDSSKLIRRLYGAHVVLIPYLRPGFKLAKLVGKAHRENPRVRAMILDKHGLVTWGHTPKAAYLETIKMVSEAERFIQQQTAGRVCRSPRMVIRFSTEERHARAAAVAPILRGAISRNKRMVMTYEDSESVLAFVNDPRARTLSQVGPFTPDHLLHTKPQPLFLDLTENGSPEHIAKVVQRAGERYRQEYIEYVGRYKQSGVTMLDPFPRVILVPKLGMFTTGKDRRAARITHDIYCHTMQVMLRATVIDSYTSLSPKEVCDFEYWPLENFKLTLLPPEKRFSRRIVLVTGAAGAIGRAIATRFVEEGASVIVTDVNEAKLQALSAELNERSGEQNTVAIPMDVRDETSVSQAFRKAVLAYGGLDILVSNAGIARSAPIERLAVNDWHESFAVNATGHFLVCREAVRIFKNQGLGGAVVVVATKNVLAPGREFGAYSASKAAQAQLARVLAIEGAAIGVRVNMVNPDAVFDGSGIWSMEVKKGRAKSYGIPVEQLEDYYVARNLLRVKISAQDVTEAVLFLASDRSAKTTGAMIPVDGGIKEAFPR